MNPQEKELLSRFLQQLASAEAAQKDAEAEAAIRDAVARQPDAAYLLVQRTLQLEQLLQASQQQVKKLEAEQGSSKGGFLNDPAWGSRPSAAPAQQQLAGQHAAPATAATAARPAPAGSWGGGLFGNIAATAAGVVAGSFLFQGIQGLMNRGDSQSPSASSDSHSADQPEQYAQAGEPELLNSYDTPDGGDTSFADSGDSGGDFA
jgi:hypothetical protein